MHLRQIKEFEMLHIIRLLSLDMFEGFHEKVGLVEYSKAKLSGFFKQLLKDSYTLNINVEKNRYGLTDYFHVQFSQRFNQQQTERMVIWLNTVGYANHYDSTDPSSWLILFHQFIYNFKYKITVAAEISNWKEIRKKYIELFDDTLLFELYKIVREKMLSNWDLEIFTLMDFCYFDEEQDPYQEIKDLFEHYALLNFIEYLVTSYNQQVLDEILNYGRKLLKELKIYHPGELMGLKELLVNIEFNKLKYVDR